MNRNEHSTRFQDQALSKARQRGARSVRETAEELNMSAGTLRKWQCRSNQAVAEATHLTELSNALAAVSCTAAQRLLALQQTHGLSSTVLHAWCREHALAEPLLIFWRDAFGATVTPQFRDAKLALRRVQSLNDGLQRELRRKEKSLAEAAA